MLLCILGQQEMKPFQTRPPYMGTLSSNEDRGKKSEIKEKARLIVNNCFSSS